MWSQESKAPAEPKGLAPRVPQVTADAAAARPRGKKLKWRTRDQQSSQLYNLQLDLNDLRQEIKALQEYEQLLRTHTLNQREAMDDYYIKRTMQYHKVFEHGYNSHSSPSGSFTSADTVEFIQNMMDNEVAVGSFVGFEVILDQWERYTSAFPGFQCVLKQSRIASVDEVAIVLSTTEYIFEITQTALQTLFPTLQNEHPHIGAKLLGQQFRGAGVTTFTFDPRSHRVVCYDTQVDFFNVFASLLQQSNELCVLFENANIREQYFIGDTSSYPVLQACDEEKARYRIAVFSDSAGDEEGGQNSPSVSHKLQLEHILAESS
ncbi:hypothetical protein DVH05_002320 [Phytophthora capsici]|nr:hypothetical protein DVH05_002320 [Phytophthora capsici]